MIKLSVISILLSVFFLQSGPGSAYAANLTQANQVSMEQEVLSYINQYRIQHGLSALINNQALSQEAAKHSADMAQHRLPFGHDRFNQRVSKLMKQLPRVNASAENVAYAYKNAEDVVNNWLKSPGHRHNIQGNYNLTGIGIAKDTQGKLYYTQLFMHERV